MSKPQARNILQRPDHYSPLDKYPDPPTGVRPRLRLVYYCWRDLADHPQFTQRLKDASGSVGHNIALRVRVAGFPECEVRWLRDGLQLQHHRPAHVELRQLSPDTYELYIRGALLTDAGTYTCVARNCAGEVRSSATVRVAAFPVAYLAKRLRRVYNGKLWL